MRGVLSIRLLRLPGSCRSAPGWAPFGPAAVNEPSARLVNLSGIYRNTRNVAALEVPANLLSRAGFRAGDTIQFQSTFHTHARADVVK